MQQIVKLGVIFTLLAGLAACAQLQTAWNTVTGARVSPQAIYIAANAADSAEIVATSYLRTCHKAGAQWAACGKVIELKVAQSVRATRDARRALRAYMLAHPDALGASGLYDALKTAQATLSQIISDYGLAQVHQ